MSKDKRDRYKNFNPTLSMRGLQGRISVKQLKTFAKASAQSSTIVDPYSCESQQLTLSQLVDEAKPKSMQLLEKKYARLNKREHFKQKALEAKKNSSSKKSGYLVYCKHYKNRRCSKSPCPFMHKEYPCKHYHLYSKCAYGDECLFTHEGLTKDGYLALQKLKEKPNEDAENFSEPEEEMKTEETDAVDINSFYGGSYSVGKKVEDKNSDEKNKGEETEPKSGKLIHIQPKPIPSAIVADKIPEKRKNTAEYLNYTKTDVDNESYNQLEKKPKFSSLDDVLQQTLGQISKKW
ncbi:DgyrCDS1822 [Dimorphilus gyrociliatus]|uniref:DgyrCDS1822 n=1 Tax=Dimorphilus gyrociliatus TaxID=2664684 RepID=A0A7I8V9W1_9ANNE|nr:DgyrCDS1822 [Dimorphilus gyrociliatus]